MIELAIIGFIAALTPGADIFYVIRNGLCKGKKAAFFAVLGILTGNIIYLTLVGLGISKIGHNPYFQLIVGIVGGVYLLKIAYLVFKEKVVIQKSCDNLKSLEIYKEALLLNLSNPKAMIFFSIIITPFIKNDLLSSLVSLFLGIALAFFLAAFISSKIEFEIKILEIIDKIASLLFVFFAIKLFILAYENLKCLLM